jgi:hypothetical protein
MPKQLTHDEFCKRVSDRYGKEYTVLGQYIRNHDPIISVGMSGEPRLLMIFLNQNRIIVPSVLHIDHGVILLKNLVKS